MSEISTENVASEIVEINSRFPGKGKRDTKKRKKAIQTLRNDVGSELFNAGRDRYETRKWWAAEQTDEVACARQDKELGIDKTRDFHILYNWRSEVVWDGETSPKQTLVKS